VLGVACGDGATPSPFGLAEGGAGGEAGAPPEPGMQPPADPALGDACVDDDQCDDRIDCTDDGCDASAGRCRFTVQHPRCDDGIHCNGAEICELGVGCRAGTPVSCSDNRSCTIDTCIEATRSCESKPRDADGDGDPIRNCDGGDCADTDPAINSNTSEICGNLRDDDCDDQIDEADCQDPAYDDCADPLEVSESGRHRLSLVATGEDFPLSCNEGEAARRDLVVALGVPEEPVDIEVIAIGQSTVPILGLAESCADQSSELVCNAGTVQPPSMGGVARTILRGLEPGTYPLFVSGDNESPIELVFDYRPASPAPENETCGTALELLPDVNQIAVLADAAQDLESACGEQTRELVYRFELDEVSDIEVYAIANDDYGVPILSLRSGDCGLESELGCRRGSPASLFARALEPGTYYLGVGSTGPSEIDVRLGVRAPSGAPEYEGCDDPPLLAAGQTRVIALETSADSVNPDCLPGAPDATFALPLDEPSDVLVVGRLSDGDFGALSLTGPGCSAAESRACQLSMQSPVRVASAGVPAGDYRVIAESALGAPMTLTAFTRPATPATLVAFADTCDAAVEIPETGGRFLGNTSNAEPDYEASCDYAASAALGGAPDQMLKLTLREQRRVVFDLGQSDYDTLLVLRDASSCPGKEITQACAPGYVEGRSFLDRVLPAGEYHVQIDGFDRSLGSWVLDVFVSDP
jgi:hypothetical protein